MIMENKDLTEKKKIKLTFGKVMIGYCGLWLVITLVICVRLWFSFSSYQANYEAAQQASCPDNFVSEYLTSFEKENIRNTAGEMWGNVSIFESDESWDDFLNEFYSDDCSISCNRVDGSSDFKPVYDVTQGNAVLGQITLKQGNESDEYGFHDYVLSDMTVSIQLPELTTYYVTALEGDKVLVNGEDITDVCDGTEEDFGLSLGDKLADWTDISMLAVTYELPGFMAEPDVVIVHNDKEYCSAGPVDNAFNMVVAYDDEFRDNMTKGVLAAGESYMMVMNRMADFSQVSKYLMPSGNAYSVIYSAHSALNWAGSPSLFEITDSELLDFYQYGEDCFIAVAHHRMHRIYRGEEYNEEMTIEWLFVNRGDGHFYAEDIAFRR